MLADRRPPAPAGTGGVGAASASASVGRRRRRWGGGAWAGPRVRCAKVTFRPSGCPLLRAGGTTLEGSSAWLTQHEEVGSLRSRPLKRHALLRVGRTAGVILGSPARPKAVRHLRRLRRVSTAATLLENGTEESQKLVRARSVLSGADHVISSSIKHGQHFIYPSWCQLAEGLRSPDANSLRFPGRSAVRGSRWRV
jgi:hypothetical protein